MPELTMLSESSATVRAFSERFLARADAPSSPSPVDGKPRDVDALIERMRRSKSWDRIDALMHSEPDEGADRSSLDLSLLNYLAFYSDGDPALMDAAFRASALYRPKWDERHSSDGRTYGQMCIERAVRDTQSTASDGRREVGGQAPRGARANPLKLTNIADALAGGPPTPDPALIDGVLRVGQKMLLSAPPKVGKSWLAIDLAAALAAGGRWLCFDCARCTVVYANLEISETSFLIRCDRVFKSRQFDAADAEPVLAFEGRGYDLDAKAFVDGLVSAWENAGCPEWGCVIVDCLYQLESGDENAVKDMRPLVAQLDRLGRVIGCAVVAVHHHSKGASGSKASIDRAAGSSVFSRWPDALIDISPLDFEEAEDNESYSQACRDACRDMEAVGAGAFRMSFDLREFPRRKPLDLLFRDGTFFPDVAGALAELPVVGSFEAGGRRGGAATRQRSARQRETKAALIEQCIKACKDDGEPPTASNVLNRYNERAGQTGLPVIQRSTLNSWLKPSGASIPFHLEPSPEGNVVTPDSAPSSEPQEV